MRKVKMNNKWCSIYLHVLVVILMISFILSMVSIVILIDMNRMLNDRLTTIEDNMIDNNKAIMQHDKSIETLYDNMQQLNNEQNVNRGSMRSLPLPNIDTSFKSYMDYRTMTSISSTQYAMQQVAITNQYGFRVIDDAYCVAMGSYYGELGTRYQITLESGQIFDVIKSEVKADMHTDSSQMYCVSDGSVLEFIVDTSKIDTKVRQMGDVSLVFSGKITSIKQIGGN